MRPAKVPSGRIGPFPEDAGTVRRARPFDLGQPAADDRRAADHRWPRILLGKQDCRGHGIDIVAVDLLHVPSAEAEARGHVVTQRQVDHPVVRHPVVVPEEDQLSEAQVPGQRDDLLPDAFLEAAVPDEGVGVMIDEVPSEPFAQERFGECHSRRIGDALAQGARRDLDPAGRVELRMALAVGSEFAEALDVVEGDLLIAAQVQKGIQQHRSVAVRLDDAVPVEPQRILRIELEVTREQSCRRIRCAQRGPRMPLAHPLDGVDRKEADGIRHGAWIGHVHDAGSSKQGSQGALIDSIVLPLQSGRRRVRAGIGSS